MERIILNRVVWGENAESWSKRKAYINMKNTLTVEREERSVTRAAQEPFASQDEFWL